MNEIISLASLVTVVCAIRFFIHGEPAWRAHNGECTHSQWIRIFTYWTVHARLTHLRNNLLLLWLLSILCMLFHIVGDWIAIFLCGVLLGGVIDYLWRNDAALRPCVGFSAGNIALLTNYAILEFRHFHDELADLESFRTLCLFTIATYILFVTAYPRRPRALRDATLVHLGGCMAGICIAVLN